eukprot:2445949-Amphidinium_carterae.1
MSNIILPRGVSSVSNIILSRGGSSVSTAIMSSISLPGGGSSVTSHSRASLTHCPEMCRERNTRDMWHVPDLRM